MNIFLIRLNPVILLCIFIPILEAQNYTFEIDYKNDQFLKDGKPFQFISGSMHYFRVPRQYWQDRMRKMKFGGLNALQTYVEWSSHEPTPGHYDFSGQNDVVEYIKMAQKEGLLVILRIGPYICAERDMGGFPYWLLKIPGIKLRTSDQKYLKEVDKWFHVLLPRIKPLLYQNGGPIITVQIENEYGSYGHDLEYKEFLRDNVHKLLGQNVVLFTTDGNGQNYIINGTIPNVLATIDFRPGTNVTKALKTLRTYQKNGPFVNSEFYTGWLDFWEDEFYHESTEKLCKTLEELLNMNASVNFYMYHGGTQFDLKAGSPPKDRYFFPALTSYDYDAPINEAGDLTDKFYAIQKVIKKFMPVPENYYQIERKSPKMSISNISMTFVGTIFDYVKFIQPIYSEEPLSFENVDLDYGFLLYETNITFNPTSPLIISVPNLRDRAHVFVNQIFYGILSRSQNFTDISILAAKNSVLSILVENQGRCSYTCFDEKKGITEGVYVNRNKSITLKHWNHYRIFTNWTNFVDKLQNRSIEYNPIKHQRIPSFYVAHFETPNKPNYPLDSFLSVDNWSKGVAILNQHILGTYWPAAGPQMTLYTPGVYFRPRNIKNQLVLFELDQSPCWFELNCLVNFAKTHILNGTIPNVF